MLASYPQQRPPFCQRLDKSSLQIRPSASRELKKKIRSVLCRLLLTRNSLSIKPRLLSDLKEHATLILLRIEEKLEIAQNSRKVFLPVCFSCHRLWPAWANHRDPPRHPCQTHQSTRSMYRETQSCPGLAIQFEVEGPFQRFTT